jgi:hypothetical protein
MFEYILANKLLPSKISIQRKKENLWSNKMTATAVWELSNSLLSPPGSISNHGIGEGRLCCVEGVDTEQRRRRRGGEEHGRSVEDMIC